MSRRKPKPRPEHVPSEQQCLRQLQQAVALAKCLAIAAEYSEQGDIDFADALAVLLQPMERATALLDQAKERP